MDTCTRAGRDPVRGLSLTTALALALLAMTNRHAPPSAGASQRLAAPHRYPMVN